MNKLHMREWLASLEGVIDNKLRKWLKENPSDNGELVERRWTYEQTHIHIKIFWEDGKETVQLYYLAPRGNHDFIWHGLNDRTFNKVMDRVGNLAQTTMHPVIDPLDHPGVV